MSLIKHQIELTNQKPFKECYWQIPHMYDDMMADLQEMLDNWGHLETTHVCGLVQWSWSGKRMGAQGSILTSGNWTVRQKGCILTTPDQWVPWQPGRVPVVLLTWPEVWVLAGQDGWGKQATDCIYHGAIGILQVQLNALQTNQHPGHFSMVDSKCLGDHNLNWCIIYFNDIVIFSRSWNRLGWNSSCLNVSYSTGRLHTGDTLSLLRE